MVNLWTYLQCDLPCVALLVWSTIYTTVDKNSMESYALGICFYDATWSIYHRVLKWRGIE